MEKNNILRKKVSFTLSAECMDLIKLLSEKKGISMAAMIEIMTRDEARREKLKAQ